MDINPPTGRWRNHGVLKIKYTYIDQSWTYKDEVFTKVYFCPWGMVNSITKLLLNERLVTHPKFIPLDVKEAFNIEDNNFDV